MPRQILVYVQKSFTLILSGKFVMKSLLKISWILNMSLVNHLAPFWLADFWPTLYNNILIGSRVWLLVLIIQLYLSKLCVVFAVRLVIPESPRWLAVHARYDEVTVLLQKMCRANKRQLPADFDAKCLVDERHKVYSESLPFIICNYIVSKKRHWCCTLQLQRALTNFGNFWQKCCRQSALTNAGLFPDFS